MPLLAMHLLLVYIIVMAILYQPFEVEFLDGLKPLSAPMPFIS